jgi:hypothetical protein
VLVFASLLRTTFSSHKINFHSIVKAKNFTIPSFSASVPAFTLSTRCCCDRDLISNKTITMINKLSPLLFLAIFLVGSPVGCMAANLRAKRSRSSSSKDAVIVNDNDVVSASSYLVFEIEGYDMDDLENISPKKQAIIDCAFHKAFDQVHGDHDGLYMSGQQIVATDKAVEDDTPGVDGDNTVGEVDLRRIRPYVYRPRKFPSKSRPRPTYPPPRPPPRQHPIKEKWHIYWHFDMSGMCNMCKFCANQS